MTNDKSKRGEITGMWFDEAHLIPKIAPNNLEQLVKEQHEALAKYLPSREEMERMAASIHRGTTAYRVTLNEEEARLSYRDIPAEEFYVQDASNKEG